MNERSQEVTNIFKSQRNKKKKKNLTTKRLFNSPFIYSFLIFESQPLKRTCAFFEFFFFFLLFFPLSNYLESVTSIMWFGLVFFLIFLFSLIIFCDIRKPKGFPPGNAFNCCLYLSTDYLIIIIIIIVLLDAFNKCYYLLIFYIIF